MGVDPSTLLIPLLSVPFRRRGPEDGDSRNSLNFTAIPEVRNGVRLLSAYQLPRPISVHGVRWLVTDSGSGRPPSVGASRILSL